MGKAQRISLREAAKLSSSWNMFSGNRCKCSGACNTRRCLCKKKGIDCSTFCHSGKNCENKKYDHSLSSSSTSFRERTTTSTASSHPPPPSTSAPPPSNVNGQPLPATASSHPPKSTHTATSCNYRTRGHGRKRCPCKQAGVVCSNSCHPGRSCVNDCRAKKASC